MLVVVEQVVTRDLKFEAVCQILHKVVCRGEWRSLKVSQAKEEEMLLGPPSVDIPVGGLMCWLAAILVQSMRCITSLQKQGSAAISA